MKIPGRVAIVTGGARGIGRAIVERYVAEGLQVAVADLKVDEAEAVAREVGREAFAVELDVSRQDSIDAMVGSVVGRTGQIDILVNSAGVFDMMQSSRLRARVTTKFSPSTSPACSSRYKR